MSRIAQGITVSIPTGKQTFGPVNVPNNVSQITFTLDRCTTATPSNWPDPNTSITFHAFAAAGRVPDETLEDASPDFIGGFTAVGGIIQGRNGELAHTTLTVQLPAGNQRKAKFTIDVANGPLVSTAAVDAT